jgi:PAS domain S-box-containing protein
MPTATKEQNGKPDPAKAGVSHPRLIPWSNRKAPVLTKGGAPAPLKWLRTIVEDGAEGAALLDRDGQVLYLAPSIEPLLGAPASELIGTPCFPRVHPADRWHALAFFKSIVREAGRTAVAQLRIRHQEGSWRWLEVHGCNRLNEPGVEAVVCHFHDVTDHRITEGQLRQSRDHFRRVFEACPLATGITTAREGRFLEVNEAFLALTGFSRCEVLGRTANELRLWVNPADRVQLLDQMRAGSWVRQYPTRFRNKAGQNYQALLSVEPLHWGDQECWLVISLDLTERLRLEEQQQRTQRLESLGALASGIAHDLSNILTPILTAAELLRQQASNPTTLDLLNLLETNARRGADLVHQILALAHCERGSGGPGRSMPSSPSPAITPAACSSSHTTEVVRRDHGRQQGVLLVDDESITLELLRSILESLGYRVWTARDGTEALRVYQESAQHIRVVVTDLVMPTMDGATLIANLRSLDPALRIICTSGLTAVQTPPSSIAADGFLAKPFSLGQLIRALQDQLALAKPA